MKSRPIDIVYKAIKVINSCSALKHIQMMDNYVDLACKRILRRGIAQNYEYATKIKIAAHYKTIELIKIAAIKNEMEI